MPTFAVHVGADEHAPIRCDLDESAGAIAPSEDHVVVTKSHLSSHSHIASNDAMSWLQLLESAAGFVYLIGSVAASATYLTDLNPTLANDLWWPGFNASGTQAFLADLVNLHLGMLPSTPLDLQLLTPGMSLLKSYATESTVLFACPSYVRNIVFESTTDLEDVIQGLHANSLNTHLPTQYCWVDFDREFEMAHTAARQTRCSTLYRDNAAVYMEAMLRNVKWDDWDKTYGGADGAFTVAIASRLGDTRRGNEWLTTVQNAFVDVATEASYWRSKNAIRWQLQWHNAWQPAVDEMLAIENAFGRRQNVAIKKIAYATEVATTRVLDLGLAADLSYAKAANMSLIRNTSNHLPDEWRVSMTGVNPTLPSSEWMRAIGPFGSIDAIVVPLPPSLGLVMAHFQRTLMAQFQANASLLKQYRAVDANKAVSMAGPIPPAWSGDGILYFGGSPLCVNNLATPFPQDSFDFADSCLSPSPLILPLQAQSSVFALIAAGFPSPSAICVMGMLFYDPDECTRMQEEHVQFAKALNVNLTAELAEAVKDVEQVHVIQFAFNTSNGRGMMLRQPLIDPVDPVWSFYGWMMMYNWAYQDREVVTFHGDHGAITVMSKMNQRQQFTPNPFEIPRQTGPYIYSLVLYSTSVLGLVALVMAVYGCVTRFRVLGRNLFRFHRVVGSVWIGRILLFVRGLTALALVGSPSVELGVTNGIASFQFIPRSLVQTIVMHSEMLWVLYVLHDFFTPFFPTYSYYGAPLSTAVSFVAGYVLDHFYPVQAYVSVDRKCTAVSIAKQISCHSGTVHFGEPSRVAFVVAIYAASVVAAYSIVVGHHLRHKSRPSRVALLLSAAAESFLDLTVHDDETESSSFDKVTCVMCGLLTFEWDDVLYIFDLKSWKITQDKTVTNFHFVHRMHSIRLDPPKFDPRSESAQLAPPPLTTLDRLKALAVLGFMAGSLTGSMLYIASTQTDLANDFWWAYFNTTGAHAYLGNWYNTQLLLNPVEFEDMLDHANHSDATAYNLSSTLITSSSLYPRLVQQFEFAHSFLRQRRCERDYAANGAMFVESGLRNADFGAIQRCWGNGFPLVMGNDLGQTTSGRAWLRSVETAATTVAEEVRVWQSYGIRHYTTAFQNFKQIGIVETFGIENAFGTVFPMTLKRTKSSLSLTAQTSMKLYWTLAMDLYAVSVAGSPLMNCSLLPRSPHYAYQNMSLPEVLMANMIIHPPFGRTFTALQSVLGPFGTIDVRHLPCPPTLRRFYKSVVATLSSVVTENDQAQLAFVRAQPSWRWAPCPAEWQGVPRHAGNILCDDDRVVESKALLSLWTDGGCASIIEFVSASRLSSIAAVVAVADDGWNPTAVCACETISAAQCPEILGNTSALTKAYVSSETRRVLAGAAAMARQDVGQMDVSLLQIHEDGTALRRPLFPPRLSGFDYFAWEFAIEWVVGKREVVSFEGDAGSLVLLRSSSAFVDTLPNPLDVPQIVALYSRAVCLYITGMISFVVVLASIAIVVSVGRVEARNILVINRVAGIVWTGRPLLFVRSVVALALLSTAKLELRQFGPLGLMTGFESRRLEWYKVILASGEVSWFVIVVGDVLTIFTQQYTTAYASHSGRLASSAVAVLSFISPVTHYVTVNRECTIPKLDFELACNAGTVHIGSSGRFVHLVGLSLGSMALCYGYKRLRFPHLEDTRHRASLLLSGGAKYHFGLDKWTYKNCVYLDRASAAITGLLCVKWRGLFYVLDIKLWRIFIMDVPPQLRVPENHPMYDRVQFAVPLVGAPRDMASSVAPETTK